MEGLLISIIVFLLCALLVHAISGKYGLNPTIGYMLMGTLIKALFPHFAQSSETESLAKFGILLLLFTMGTHLPLEKLKTFKKYLFPLGTCQMAFGTGLFWLLFKAIGLSNTLAFNIAFGCSLSSTAIAIQALTDMHELQSKFGRASFAVLLAQDVAVILFIAAFAPSNNATGSSSILSTIVKALVALSAVFAAASGILNKLYKWASTNSPEAFAIVVLLNICGISAITQYLGMSMELGAFIAGVLVSGSEYRYQVQVDLRYIKGLLMGLYFTTIGFMLDCSYVYNNFLLVIASVTIFFALKIISSFFASLVSRMPISHSVMTAAVLAAGGEFAFVLLNSYNIDSNIIPEIKKLTIITIALAMILAQPLIKLLYKFFKTTDQVQGVNLHVDDDGISDHVIIAGFGSFGRTMAEILRELKIPYIGVDFNPEIISRAVAAGFKVYYGDIRTAEIFRELKIDESKAVVITINDDKSAIRVISMLRRIYKNDNIKIFLRAYRPHWVDKLAEADVHVVKPETMEMKMQLVNLVLRSMNLESEVIDSAIHQYYQSHHPQHSFSNKPEEHIDIDKMIHNPDQ